MSDKIDVGSAGTNPRHIGAPPDPRAVNTACKRGYDLTPLRVRQFDVSDLGNYDLLLAMDQGHYDHMLACSTSQNKDRIHLFLEPVSGLSSNDVPDPYYGDPEDYECALDLIEAGIRVWFQEMRTSLAIAE